MVTHNETSTGVTHPLEAIAKVAKEEFNKLLLVDAVSTNRVFPDATRREKYRAAPVPRVLERTVLWFVSDAAGDCHAAYQCGGDSEQRPACFQSDTNWTMQQTI